MAMTIGVRISAAPSASRCSAVLHTATAGRPKRPIRAHRPQPQQMGVVREHQHLRLAAMF
jgi:hypothetical protein